MLSCADFPPLPPLTLPTQHRRGVFQRPAGKRTCRAREGLLSSGLGSPQGAAGAAGGGGWDQGMEAMSAGGSPFPKSNRPHARAAGKEAFLSSSLPGNGEKTGSGALSSCWRVGGGGAALQFPPDQGAEFGEWEGGVRTGTCGLPRPTPHPRWGSQN